MVGKKIRTMKDKKKVFQKDFKGLFVTNGRFLHESLPWVGIDGSCNQGSSGIKLFEGEENEEVYC